MIEEEREDLELQRMTRRSLLGAAGGILAAGAGLGWLMTRSKEGQLPWPLRRMLEFNETFGTSVVGVDALAPDASSLPLTQPPRVNGRIGRGSVPPASEYALRISIGGRTVAALSLTDVMALPKTVLTTEMKCVEGWSQVVRWGGVKLSDLLASAVGSQESKYVQTVSLDGKYFVGLDWRSAIHPQTLVCYELNGAPLPALHGAPLRVYLTNKYGYKSLKWLGEIRLTSNRPKDYWAERGYDWFGGL